MKTLITDKPSKHYIKWLLIILAGLFIFSSSAYGVKTFFSQYGLQSPVIIRSFLYKKSGEVAKKPPKATPKPTTKPQSLVPVAEAKTLTNKEILSTQVNHSESWYKLFIYEHESGNNPTRVNSNGCIGLGQDCNGNLIKQCPTLDYGCEDIFFENYMQTHIDLTTGKPYGTWKQAYISGMSRGTPGVNDGWGNW